MRWALGICVHLVPSEAGLWFVPLELQHDPEERAAVLRRPHELGTDRDRHHLEQQARSRSPDERHLHQYVRSTCTCRQKILLVQRLFCFCFCLLLVVALALAMAQWWCPPSSDHPPSIRCAPALTLPPSPSSNTGKQCDESCFCGYCGGPGGCAEVQSEECEPQWTDLPDWVDDNEGNTAGYIILIIFSTL